MRPTIRLAVAALLFVVPSATAGQDVADSLVAGLSAELRDEMAAERGQTVLALTDRDVRAMIAAGDSLFHAGSCVRCHGQRGTEGAFAPDLTNAEWLHSQGDFEGIFRTVFWGVPRDRIKAVRPRPFEMHPRGGMVIDRRQIRDLAAYVWSLSRDWVAGAEP